MLEAAIRVLGFLLGDAECRAGLLRARRASVGDEALVDVPADAVVEIGAQSSDSNPNVTPGGSE